VDTLTFARPFQLWSYVVSHGQLLMRSPRGQSFDTRIDVLFTNVQAIMLPAVLDSCRVSELDGRDETDIPDLVAGYDAGAYRLFAVADGDRIGYVLAGAIAWSEDEEEYDAPSALGPDL
jgi:hypothetical protein